MIRHYDEYVCANCGNITYKPIYYQNTIIKRQVEATKQRNEENEKRLQRNMKARHQRFYKKREKVQEMVREHGITKTAKLLNKAPSSIGLLAKGISTRKFNRGKFPRSLKLKVAIHANKINNNKDVSRNSLELFGQQISRGSIQNWRREYAEHQGQKWD